MKNYTIYTIICSLLLISTVQAQYKITVKIDGYDLDTCILGYQVGQKTYVAQKLYERNDKGDFVFEGEEALLGGLYSILIKPKNMFFQFIISNDEEQKNLKISTKIAENPATDLTKNLKVHNSPDNDVFVEYKTFLGKMRAKADRYSAQLTEAKQKKDSASIAKATELLGGLDGEVEAFQDDLLKRYPDYLSPKLISGNRQPQIPKELVDRMEIFKYYKAHFWDGYDWGDERLIRTPLLMDKMDQYIDKLTYQNVDSISKSCIDIIDRALAGKNKEVFQFVAVHFLNKYAKQEVICMEGVYVDIAQKYYCNGLAYWIDSAQVEKICEDAARMAPLRCGKNAPEARLKNINDSSYVSLYSIRKPFVAVYFWDPTCGNCAKMSKKLVPIYNKYKDKGFEIYGVCSKPWKEVDMCRKKATEQEMNWINTSDDPYPLAYVKKYYDLRSNPFIYLLNEDKEIIYKRLTAEQLDEILEREFKLYEENKKK